jgi:phosphoglycolate phosphatase
MALGAIAFDLDGTLVDSAADIGHALNIALRGSGLPPVPIDGVRGWIGDGPDVLIAHALHWLGQGSDDVARHAELRAAFDAATLAEPLQHGAVFEGVAAMLDALHADLPMVVVTNKPTALARAVLDAAGLLRHFVEVFGADRPEWRKPSPHLLLRAADRLKVPPAGMLMVGDGAADAIAAQRAGAPMVRVDWGYGGAHDWPQGAQRRIACPAQLAGIVRSAVFPAA